MESMVGRSAAPKGVERKSEGRSCGLNALIGEEHREQGVKRHTFDP